MTEVAEHMIILYYYSQNENTYPTHHFDGWLRIRFVEKESRNFTLPTSRGHRQGRECLRQQARFYTAHVLRKDAKF